jgi:hypothetical protein
MKTYTIEEIIKTLNYYLNGFHPYDKHIIKVMQYQIELLKAEKQRLENYELIKNEIVSGH